MVQVYPAFFVSQLSEGRSETFLSNCCSSELRPPFKKVKTALKSSIPAPQILLVRSLLQSIYWSDWDSSIVAPMLARRSDAGVIVEAAPGVYVVPWHNYCPLLRDLWMYQLNSAPELRNLLLEVLRASESNPTFTL